MTAETKILLCHCWVLEHSFVNWLMTWSSRL